MKYNMRRQEEGEEEVDSDCEIQQLKQKIRLRRQQIRRSRLPPCADPQHSKATSSEELFHSVAIFFLITFFSDYILLFIYHCMVFWKGYVYLHLCKFYKYTVI